MIDRPVQCAFAYCTLLFISPAFPWRYGNNASSAARIDSSRSGLTR